MKSVDIIKKFPDGLNLLRDMTEQRRIWWNHSKDITKDDEIVKSIANEIFNGSSESIQALEVLTIFPHLLIELIFTIVDKNGKRVPFFLNDVQREFIKIYEENGGDKEHPYVILKGRQQGMTSLITAICLSNMIMRPNFYGCTLADDSSKTIDLFEKKGKQLFDRIAAPQFKPTKSRDNLNQLSFAAPSSSSWRVKVASPDVERGETITFLHCSEVATFPCLIEDMQASAIEGVVPNGTIIYESTANGYNQFRDLWEKPTNIRIFFEWWRTSEYRRKDIDMLDDIEDKWLRERVEWLKDEKHLDDEQLAWYVAKYYSYVSPEKIRQEYPCTPNEAFLASGDCVFSVDQITKRMDKLQNVKNYAIGYFTYEKHALNVDENEINNIRWVDDINGYIRIHKPPMCKAKNTSTKEIINEMPLIKANDNSDYKIEGLLPYVIGGDTAGEGSDLFTAKVINARTCEEVATLEIRNIDDDLYADQVYCLAKMYNDALVGIEVNFSYAPTKELLKLKYPNLYVRENLTDEGAKSEHAKYGFYTDRHSRMVILSDFQRKFRENQKIINDIPTLRQMMTFITNKDTGKAEAAAGQHDDLVMAEMIGQSLASSAQCDRSYKEYNEEINDVFAEFKKFFGIEKQDGETDFDGIEGYVEY